VPVVAGRVTEVRFEVVPSVDVVGVVRDHARGPLAKVNVTVTGSAKGARSVMAGTTDEEGRYRIRDVPPGEYRISASGGAIGYSRRPQAPLRVTAPGPVTKDIVVGLPGLTTDENGRAVYDRIVPGRYTLDLRADGVGRAKIAVTVPPGETSVDVRLE
jgi:protocatechuate 3,4-dioxygenase beta subunit